MILRKLRAENFLKYTRLEVSDLPAKGIIGIHGRNETGKSAIVEAICFALFGRTYALPVEEMAKAVHWGAASASVTLEFSDAKGTLHTITRYLDQDGAQRARLGKGNRKEALVQGAAEVNAALTALTGFDFTRYGETLYLAQKRGDQAGASTHTIKVLAGVDTLERIAATLREEMRVSEEAIQRESQRAHQFQERIGELGVRDEALGELESRRDGIQREIREAHQEIQLWEKFGQEIDQAARQVEEVSWTREEVVPPLGHWQRQLEQMRDRLGNLYRVCHDSHVEMEQDPTTRMNKWVEDLALRLEPAEALQQQALDYRDSLLTWLDQGNESGESLLGERRQLARRSAGVRMGRRLTTPFLLLSGLLAGISGGLWHLFSRQPDHELAVAAANLLTQHLPQWDPSQLEPLLMAAGITGALFLLLLTRFFSQGRHLRAFAVEEAALRQRQTEYQTRIDLLNQVEGLPLPEWAETLDRFQEAPWKNGLESWRNGEGSLFLEPGGLAAHMTGYRRKLEEMRQDIEQIREDVQGSMEDTREAIGQLQEEEHRTGELIREEQHRRQQDRDLRTQMAVIEENIALERHRILVRQAGRHLLRVTAAELSLHFNQELHRFLTRVVPLFTEARYHELRIGADLTVEVFSKDKNDFISMEEISSGVQHQLLLAVRVALAQALVSRSGSAPQFLILDEPFAFFDRVRQNQTLASLREISDDLAQIWVITQEFDPEPGLDRLMTCTLSDTTLTTA